MNSNNIELPQNKDCAFCSYLRGDRSYTILAQDDLTATFVTREQRGVAHLLVIPKRHVPTILELNDLECDAVMVNVRNAAILIDNAYKRPGISIWQNNGKPSGQAISHVHFHIAGTLENGGTEWGEVPEIPVDETDKIAKKLLNGITDL